MKKVRTVPHQWVITIAHRAKVEHPYMVISEREMMTAAKLLNDRTAAHILYYYLACNSNDYTFALSPSYIEEQIGITEKQYHKAKKKLKDAGYLIPDGDKRDHYLFVRLPKQYAEVTSEAQVTADTVPMDIEKRPLESEQKPKLEEPSAESNAEYPPSGIDQQQEKGGKNEETPSKEGSSIPVGTHQPARKVERNNIYSINNIINKANPVMKEDEESKKAELSDWIHKIEESFGHLEDCWIELVTAEHQARRHGGYTIDKHIYWIKKTFQKLSDREKERIDWARREYQREVQKTMPTPFKEGTIVKLILDRLAREKKLPHNFGVWIDGWDQDKREPKLRLALNVLPLEVVRMQQHNVDGIPEWYWRGKNPDE